MVVSRSLAAVVLAFGLGAGLAGCSDDDADADSADAANASSTTAAPTPAAIPADATLAPLLGTDVAWEPLDALATGTRFSVTAVPTEESIFAAYYTAAGAFDGDLVVAAVLRLQPGSDDPRQLQRLFSSQWPSQPVNGTSVYINQAEEQLVWYAAPHVFMVGADDGEVALALAEAMLA